ncbi:hypothetical protein ACFX2G_043358 [Malus domestica]
MHKRLLHVAHDPATRPAVQVRLGQGIIAIGSYLLSQSFMQVCYASGSNSSRKANVNVLLLPTKRVIHRQLLVCHQTLNLLLKLTGYR